MGSGFGRAYPGTGQGYDYAPVDEKDFLEQESSWLQSRLDWIRQRLQELGRPADQS